MPVANIAKTELSSPSPAVPSEVDQYCLETGRLQSFADSWPHSDDTLCSRENMAKAGFFYTRMSDCVQCFVCHIKLANWDPHNDDPWEKHLECSANCYFAKIGTEEANQTVEQWCDVICNRIINQLDCKFDKIQKYMNDG